ncbi:hypothetical protein QFZ37_003060 [Chryseobacterium ginsenosidimutans]|uniref:hypothetical protein n=1 Tax=Chryseobacterium ginsenosidimutans TaxID=687846 RepID=UPI0027850556|nr:hypothetical protein [Chryseobacterium ginsenosidimutans]MDQ0594691.1 hypothetical protein [Chryseobacterium ginsenosidimutans]
MKEENINKLNSLFSNLKTEEEKLKESLAKKKSEEDLFVEGFKTLCRNLIDPKMQEFRRMLKENGFGCKITLNEENKNGLGINSQPNIKLQISRNIDSNFYANDKFPHVMFAADKNLKRIAVHQDTIFQNGTGNAALKEQTYTLETLDEENIEKEILHSIENILTNK